MCFVVSFKINLEHGLQRLNSECRTLLRLHCKNSRIIDRVFSLCSIESGECHCLSTRACLRASGADSLCNRLTEKLTSGHGHRMVLAHMPLLLVCLQVSSVNVFSYTAYMDLFVLLDRAVLFDSCGIHSLGTHQGVLRFE